MDFLNDFGINPNLIRPEDRGPNAEDNSFIAADVFFKFSFFFWSWIKLFKSRLKFPALALAPAPDAPLPPRVFISIFPRVFRIPYNSSLAWSIIYRDFIYISLTNKKGAQVSTF